MKGRACAVACLVPLAWFAVPHTATATDSSALRAAHSFGTTEDLSMKLSAGDAPVLGHVANATWELKIDDSSAGHRQTVSYVRHTRATPHRDCC